MIIVIGVLGMRKTRSFSDFFLAGGGVGPWMTAFTYAASYFSAVLFIGFAGKIGWAFGYSALWIAGCNALVGVLGVWWLLGKRVKRIAVQYDAHTMPEFFEHRYQSRFLKFFAAVCIFVFFVPYTAAVFMGLSYLFESNFDIPFGYALLAMGGFTALYLVLGGYKSMTMIDVVFGMIMAVGVCILLVFTIHKGGGLSRMTADLAAINPKLTQLVGPPGWWPLFCLVFLTSVAPFGMPQLLQKFYAIKDERAIRVGMIASTCFALLIGSIAYFVGATTRLFLTPAATPKAFTPDGAPLVDNLMPEMLANIVPESLSILMLLLVLSASMSTLAALVLISSGAVIKDLYAGFAHRSVSDRTLTLLMRVASAVFVALSVALAWTEPATIVTVLAISWGAIGSVFLGPFVWGIFSPRVGRGAAIASAVLGLGACLGVFAWYGFDRRHTPDAGTIGMLVSLALPPVLSLVMPARTAPAR
jgi:SSS family solute:Na+ symporter/sodium/proline symporter